MDKLYTIKDVAEILRLSPRTVRRLVKAGKLPKISLTKKAMRFKPLDVEKYIDASCLAQCSTLAKLFVDNIIE